jgi:CBS domain-containing protein
LSKTAREIMVDRIITVKKETSLRDLAAILTSNHIGGAPVMDDSGRYLGVVGEHDLIRHEKPLHIPTVITLFDSWIPLELPSTLKKEMERISATRVGDLYNPKAPTVLPDTPLREIVQFFAREDVDILPVLDQGQLLGVIGRTDLVHLLVTGDDLTD